MSKRQSTGQGLGIGATIESPVPVVAQSNNNDDPEKPASNWIEELQVPQIPPTATPRLELSIPTSPPLSTFWSGYEQNSMAARTAYVRENPMPNVNSLPMATDTCIEPDPTRFSQAPVADDPVASLDRRDTIQSSSKSAEVQAGPSELGDFVMRKRSRYSVLLEEKRRNHLFDGRRASDIPNISQMAELFHENSSSMPGSRKPSDNYSILTSDAPDNASLPFLVNSPETINSSLTDSNHVAAHVLNEYSRNIATGTFKVGHKATRSLLTPPLRHESINVEICEAEAKGKLQSSTVNFEEGSIHETSSNSPPSTTTSPTPPTSFSEILPRQRLHVPPPLPPPKAPGRSFKTLLSNHSTRSLKDVIHGFKSKPADHEADSLSSSYYSEISDTRQASGSGSSVIYKPQNTSPQESKFQHKYGRKIESPFSPAKEYGQALESPPSSMSSPTPLKQSYLDRGRLFLRIQQLKGIPRLHLFKDRKIVLTLDNGLQTLKTAPCPVADLANLNHEFELVVLTATDLQLAITFSVDNPPQRPALIPSAFKAPIPPSPERKKRFSLFPRKNNDNLTSLDNPKVQSAESTAQEQFGLSPADLAILPFLGSNGEFTRTFIIASDYENEVFGQRRSVLLECRNEWKVSPSKFGSLQVEMMFVPRFSRKEQVPSSMNAALSQLEFARKERSLLNKSGFLSQLGGDCAYWRRRWFVFENMTLTGHHEETRKVRNMINMYNVTAVTIDTEAMARRAFKLEFHDGEILSFYADSEQMAREWTLTLSRALKFKQPETWTDLVLSQ